MVHTDRADAADGTRFDEDLPRIRPALTAAAFLVLAVFYAVTAPANRTEADDALWYAADVERLEWPGLFQPLHLLYLPLGRAAWQAAKGFGGPERAYPLLALLGAICMAAAMVVAWDLLVRRLNVRPLQAACATGLLAFSYGVWRYAAEAEVYAPAFLGSAVLAHLALAAHPGAWNRVGLVVSGAATPFLYSLAVGAAAVAVPVARLSRHGWRETAAYVVPTGVLGVGLATLGYVAAGRPGSSLIEFYRGGEGGLWLGSVADLGRHLLAASQVLVSGNFVLVYETVREALPGWLPGRMLQDELYAGIHAPPLIGWLAPLTLLALFSCVIWFVLAVRRPERSAARRAARRMGAAWLAAHVLLGVAFSRAGQPEVWLLAVFPAWLLAVSLLVPDGDAVAPTGALCAALMVHNAIGGLAVYQSVDGDRHRAKATWLVETSVAEDVILTAESAGFARYLSYWAPSNVVNLQFLPLDTLGMVYDSAVSSGARVFATGEVFDPPEHYRALRPILADSLQALMARSRNDFVLRRTDEFGGVFEHVAGMGGGEAER